MSRHRRRHGRSASLGQSIVELALILPIMLLLLAVATDLGRMFHSRIVIANAARAGALEATRHPTSYIDGGACDAQVNRIMCAIATESEGAILAITPSDVTVVCEPDPCSEALGNVIRVSVEGQFTLITPFLSSFFGGSVVTLESTATAQIAVRPNIAPDGSGSPSPTPSPTPICFPPDADFVFTPSTGKKKQTDFQFTDLSTSAPECPLTYSWNFGDGAGSSSTSTLQNPVHEYQAQGTYTITLVVSNAGGSDSRDRTVTVTP